MRDPPQLPISMTPLDLSKDTSKVCACGLDMDCERLPPAPSISDAQRGVSPLVALLSAPPPS